MILYAGRKYYFVAVIIVKKIKIFFFNVVTTCHFKLHVREVPHPHQTPLTRSRELINHNLINLIT